MTDFGRSTRAYVSAYQRSRVHQSRLYRFERRRFIANFNGLLPPGEQIQCTTWRTDAPEIGVMSDIQISADGRESSILFAAQLGGWANMRCEVTLDGGEIYTQVFRVNVREASYFFDDPPTQAGPFSLTVCVSPPVPPVLTDITADQIEATIEITWTPASFPSSAVASYQIYRAVVFGEDPAPDPGDYTIYDTVEGDVLTYLDETTPAFNTYYYYVIAISQAAEPSDPSNILFATLFPA